MYTSVTIPGLSRDAGQFVDAPHRLLINGEWVMPAGGAELDVYDPSTARKVTRVAHAGSDDVDRAVTAARAALDGPWGRMSMAERTAILNRLADLLEEHAPEFAQLEALDSGKPVTYAEMIDVKASIEWLRYYAGWPTKIRNDTATLGSGDSLYYSRKRPIGVCGLIVPWNFPLMIAIWKVAPALAAGCTILLKPAEQTPLTALRFGQLTVEAGLPSGVFNVLTGDGSTGAAIVDHPDVDKISFTGSTGVGRRIGASAGQALKRVTLELGGKSAGIILPDADLGEAIPGAYDAIYFNSGQTCNAASRLFVPERMFEDVISQLAALVAATRPLPGLDPASTLGPVVSKAQFDRVNGYVQAGIDENAELIVGGVAEDDGSGWFIPPTLFVSTDDSHTIAREEIFGPVLVASPYREVDEVVRRANDSEYGLAAGLWTRDLSSAHRIAQRLDAGSVYVNGWAQSAPNVPFGGIKSSGIGREHGEVGLESYLEQKSVLVALD